LTELSGPQSRPALKCNRNLSDFSTN